ncbi:NADH-quinone oxidoreductase subunit J [Mobiluncus mulieris]|uniref:NADH-quinone oxidoreductase subunit J n=1 Tax=Mobiluncus mulieris TaxID=2052 RepID=A0ABD4TXQ2_9ACTO|nr:NADH-quinone oxidoreductase subunit J [Mobiluncus mulieris]MCU9968782.1 NADH-quinone oxidoreductase subunit J [Mobiluncus mulieris]MCU9973386.1 NADH-quinone oxidoreductase subunit J [Mobiluncus mulieris]NMW74634.1 NADH-quinone oxidoreductase subunit J [Mobiluncus mulieris]
MNTLNALVPAVLPLAKIPLGQAIFLVVASGAALVCGLSVAFSRRAVHAAVYMLGMMISLAGIYFSLGAEFLGAVQIVVYTGAIMMMILFVIMLVGVQSIDAPRESERVTVVAAVLMAVALAILAIVAASHTTMNALIKAPDNPADNPVQIAGAIINQYYFPMEMVACLLIIAAVGAMTLTHSDALLPRLTQRFVVEQRMKAYRDKGTLVGQQVPPGVYAQTNALDVPAINGETQRPEESSVPRVIRVRGEARTLGEASPWAARALATEASGGVGLHGVKATHAVARSQAWGMPGEDAPEIGQPLMNPELAAGQTEANPELGGGANSPNSVDGANGAAGDPVKKPGDTKKGVQS